MREVSAVDQLRTKVTPADRQCTGSGGIRILIVNFIQGLVVPLANKRYNSPLLLLSVSSLCFLQVQGSLTAMPERRHANSTRSFELNVSATSAAQDRLLKQVNFYEPID